MGIIIGVQLERDQPDTYPDSIRTLSNTIMRFFVNDAYWDAVSQQCNCNRQSRRTTANLTNVSFNYSRKLERLTTRTGKTEAVIMVLVKLSFTRQSVPFI